VSYRCLVDVASSIKVSAATAVPTVTPAFTAGTTVSTRASLARLRKPFLAVDRFFGDVFLAVEPEDLRVALDLAADDFAVVFFADVALRAGAFFLAAVVVFFVELFFAAALFLAVESFFAAELFDPDLVFFVGIFLNLLVCDLY
jgi:hypothetical protein